MSKYLMVPAGLESDSTSSDSEPEQNQYIIKPSVALSSSSEEEDSDEPITDSEGSDPNISAGKKPVVAQLLSSSSDDEDSYETMAGPDSDTEGPDPKINGMFRVPPRFFPEEDEIVLLNGMIRFAEEKKYGPLANLEAFRKFVKADLKVDPTTEQLRYKIHKFRWKLNNNLKKETRGNARRLKAHERRAYELSKLVWANEHIKNQKSSRGQKAKAKRAKAKVDLAAPTELLSSSSDEEEFYEPITESDFEGSDPSMVGLPGGSDSGAGEKPVAAKLLSLSSDEEDSDESMDGSESDSQGSDPKINGMVGAPGGFDSGGKKPVVKRKASEMERPKKKSNGFDRLVPDRFFPLEDEFVLLDGMIRFAQEKKCGPLANLEAFRMFVKGDLKVDPTTEQLRYKIYKFKTKLKRNLKEETRGNARRLNAHERRTYELSKLAWANEYIKNQKSPRGRKTAAKREKAKVGLAVSCGGPSKAAAAGAGMELVCVDDGSVDKTNSSRNGAEIFQKGKGVEELEWAELMKAEMRVYLKKLELMGTKTSQDLEVLKSKNC